MDYSLQSWVSIVGFLKGGTALELLGGPLADMVIEYWRRTASELNGVRGTCLSAIGLRYGIGVSVHTAWGPTATEEEVRVLELVDHMLAEYLQSYKKSKRLIRTAEQRKWRAEHQRLRQAAAQAKDSNSYTKMYATLVDHMARKPTDITTDESVVSNVYDAASAPVKSLTKPASRFDRLSRSVRTMRSVKGVGQGHGWPLVSVDWTELASRRGYVGPWDALPPLLLALRKAEVLTVAVRRPGEPTVETSVQINAGGATAITCLRPGSVAELERDMCYFQQTLLGVRDQKEALTKKIKFRRKMRTKLMNATGVISIRHFTAEDLDCDHTDDANNWLPWHSELYRRLIAAPWTPRNRSYGLWFTDSDQTLAAGTKAGTKAVTKAPVRFDARGYVLVFPHTTAAELRAFLDAQHDVCEAEVQRVSRLYATLRIYTDAAERRFGIKVTPKQFALSERSPHVDQILDAYERLVVECGDAFQFRQVQVLVVPKPCKTRLDQHILTIPANFKPDDLRPHLSHRA